MQTTLVGLVARAFPVGRVEHDDAVARLKGDGRFAAVIRAAALARLRLPVDDVTLMTDFGSVRIVADDVAEFMTTVLSRDVALNDGRSRCARSSHSSVWQGYLERLGSDPGQHDAFVGRLRTSKEFKALLDGLWPAMTAGPLSPRSYRLRARRCRRRPSVTSTSRRSSARTRT